MTKSILGLILIFIMGLPNVANARDWNPELHAIAIKCQIPSKNLRWINNNVQWLKPETLTYDQVTCVLEQLKINAIPTKQGFVTGGN